jgi:DNA invertase Pin-like site-specific DNA recombinase
MSKKVEHAALYVRSANHSKQSLDSQRTKGEYYAKQHALHLSIIEDPQLSGLVPLEERAGLRWLVHLVEVGLIKTVIVDSVIRISRKFEQLYYFKSLLRKHNAKLIILEGVERYEK